MARYMEHLMIIQLTSNGLVRYTMLAEDQMQQNHFLFEKLPSNPFINSNKLINKQMGFYMLDILLL